MQNIQGAHAKSAKSAKGHRLLDGHWSVLLVSPASSRFTAVMEESGEKCTVVFALIVKEPASE